MTDYIIPLNPVANQNINIWLAKQNCKIQVRETTQGVFLSLKLNNTPIKNEVLCRNKVGLIGVNSFKGDLYFLDTQGGDDPVSSGLGSRFLLVYGVPPQLSAPQLPASTPPVPPLATDDTVDNVPSGQSAYINPLLNDVTGANPISPITLKITGTSAAGESLNIAGEGVWVIERFTGKVVFTPESGFTGNPTPISYTVKDTTGVSSNAATITVTYLQPTGRDTPLFVASYSLDTSTPH